jgi:DNA-binding transcriptional LysR family regulator
MTQPAVTFQVRQLEEYFNTRLFDRTHNRIGLTEAGLKVYEYAERIFGLYAEMEAAVRDLTGEMGGAVTIGASTTIAEYMLPSLLGDFRAEHPDVRIHLRVSNTDGVVSMVESNVIDLGVVEAPVSNRNLWVQVCRMDQLVVILPPGHPLSTRQRVRISDLVNYPFICREEGSGTRGVINEYVARQGAGEVELDVGIELGSPEAIKGAVEAGMGISVVSRSTIDKELRLATLVAVPLDPPMERPFSFVRQRQKFRQRAVEELLTFAQGHCQKQEPSDTYVLEASYSAQGG